MFPLFSLSPRLKVSVPAPIAVCWLVGLLLLFTQCNAPRLARAENASTCTLDDALDAVCRIHAPDGSLGTGCVFAIDEGRDAVYALTNAHVAGERAGGEVTVEFWRDGHASRELPGSVDFAVLNDDLGCDIAVVAVRLSTFGQTPPRVIALQERGLEICPGDPVVSVGCARGAWPSLFRGHVAELEPSRITFVPPVANGRSGSALLTSDGSRIIGLVGWRRDDTGVGVAMNLESVYGALNGELLAGHARPSEPGIVRAGELSMGGRLAPIPIQQPGQNCPDGNCWRPFRGFSSAPRTAPPSKNPQPNNSGGAWPGLSGSGPRSSSSPETSIDHSQFATKNDLAALRSELTSPLAKLEQLPELQKTIEETKASTGGLKAKLDTALQTLAEHHQVLDGDNGLLSRFTKLHQVVSDVETKAAAIEAGVPGIAKGAALKAIEAAGAQAAGALPAAAAPVAGLATLIGGPLAGGVVSVLLLFLGGKLARSKGASGGAPGQTFRAA